MPRGSRVAWSILERLGRLDGSSNLPYPINLSVCTTPPNTDTRTRSLVRIGHRPPKPAVEGSNPPGSAFSNVSSTWLRDVSHGETHSIYTSRSAFLTSDGHWPHAKCHVKVDKTLVVATIITLATSLIATVYLLATPISGEPFTELDILGRILTNQVSGKTLQPCDADGTASLLPAGR